MGGLLHWQQCDGWQKLVRLDSGYFHNSSNVLLFAFPKYTMLVCQPYPRHIDLWIDMPHRTRSNFKVLNCQSWLEVSESSHSLLQVAPFARNNSNSTFFRTLMYHTCVRSRAVLHWLKKCCHQTSTIPLHSANVSRSWEQLPLVV